MKQIPVRFSLEELSMLRHAMKIGAEDGSLLGQLDDGSIDPEDRERQDRIDRKINEAIMKLREDGRHG